MERARLPRDVQQRCVWLVRGYERCCTEYKERRQAIIDGVGGNYTSYMVRNAVLTPRGDILQAEQPRIVSFAWRNWSGCPGCERCTRLNTHGRESEKECPMICGKCSRKQSFSIASLGDHTRSSAFIRWAFPAVNSTDTETHFSGTLQLNWG